jgi:hypothetical protein
MQSRRARDSFRSLLWLLLLPLLLQLNACSFLADTHQTVQITASDLHATIYVDGREVGVGSAAPLLDRDKNHRVRAQAGERRVYAYIGRKASSLGTVDIVCGLLFGVSFIGYYAPGFWELEPGSLTLKVPEARVKCKYCNR